MAEQTPSLSTQKEQTLSFADFLRQYEGKNAEWHAGQVVEKVTNNTRHNLIQGFLYQLLSIFLDMTKRGQVILAGVPMYISDDAPAREPDLMILLNENRDCLTDKYVAGPVDIAVEIISPGSDSIDRGEKFVEYESAGVREYWLIDPIRNEAIVYVLNEDGRYQRLAEKDDTFTSNLLANFALKKSVLWQADLPKSMAILELANEMLGMDK